VSGQPVRFEFVAAEQAGFRTYAALLEDGSTAVIEGADHTWTVTYKGGGAILSSLEDAKRWVERHAREIMAGEPVTDE
jgi:hypothetical protein